MAADRFWFADERPANLVAQIFKGTGEHSPSPRRRGPGEDGRSNHSCFRISFSKWAWFSVLAIGFRLSTLHR